MPVPVAGSSWLSTVALAPQGPKLTGAGFRVVLCGSLRESAPFWLIAARPLGVAPPAGLPGRPGSQWERPDSEGLGAMAAQPGGIPGGYREGEAVASETVTAFTTSQSLGVIYRAGPGLWQACLPRRCQSR